MLLVIGAALLYGAERIATQTRQLWQLTRLDALLIGLAQAFALFPGISRSGITIAAGLSLGLERTGAARFAFLMGIPVIAGATVWKMRSLDFATLGSTDALALMAGMAAAAIAGVLAITVLLRYLARSQHRRLRCLSAHRRRSLRGAAAHSLSTH